MTKADLPRQIAEKAGITTVTASQALDTLLDVITAALKSGEDVKLPGFGSLKTEQRAPRQGRNPRTGDPIHIPASKIVKFTPGKALKEAVQETT